MRTVALALLAFLSANVCPAFAQNTTLLTRIVNVAGGDMRVWTEGLEQRQPGKPVVILEAGAGNGLEAWRPVFADIGVLFTSVAVTIRYGIETTISGQGPGSAVAFFVRSAYWDVLIYGLIVGVHIAWGA